MAVTEICKDGRLYQKAGAWRERGRLGYYVSDLYKSVYEQQIFLFFKGWFNSTHKCILCTGSTDLLRFACRQSLLCQEAYQKGKRLETLAFAEEDSAACQEGKGHSGF